MSSGKEAPQHEKKVMAVGKKKGSQKGKPAGAKKENLATSSFLTEFSYAVECSTDVLHVPELAECSLDVLLTSIPEGYAILDTGCATSVVGSVTAERYKKFFESQCFPPPVPLTLPPVELKAFNGGVEKTTKGLRWNAKLGSCDLCGRRADSISSVS